jgi:iron complex outermembrane receptor protein
MERPRSQYFSAHFALRIHSLSLQLYNNTMLLAKKSIPGFPFAHSYYCEWVYPREVCPRDMKPEGEIIMRIKGALRISAATGLALTLGAGSRALAQPASDAIPPMLLHTALDALAHRSGLEIVYVSKIAEGLKTRGAPGGLSPEETLSRLLSGTGLIYRHEDDAYMILAAETKRAAAPSAPAPAAAPNSNGVETVVVTAQHKSENIQQVPIAITALSQKDLTDRQIAAGPDLLRDVPNMNFTKTNFSGYDIELRGIGTQAISVTTDPAVAVAFNGTPFIRNHFFEQEFFDLDDVEVLLGPQGTLYGRNATAGVVNLKSALPTDQYEAMLSADIGNYNGRRLEAMLNIPIVGDQLDIRFAGEWTKRNGYTIDTTYNTPVDGRDLWSGRMTIGWNPTSDFHSDFIWEHFSEDDDRLRSGKQLCETSQPVTSIKDSLGKTVQVPAPNGGDAGGGVLDLSTNDTSQGCQATSLYAPSAFEVPYGPSLPYIDALNGAGHIVPAGFDPYSETTQSTNLRDIQSQLLPTYRARNDTLEYNANWSINRALTLASQTGFNQDFLWSTEDYNRFDTAPGAFVNGGGAGANNLIYPWFQPDPLAGTNGISPNAMVFCDPQLGCSDRIVAEDLDEEHAWQVSQEFRLSSNFSGPFNFSVGGNYLHYETEENYYVFINALSIFALEQGYGGGFDGIGSTGGSEAPTPSGPSCLLSFSRMNSGFQSPNPTVRAGTPDNGDCVYVDPNPIGSLNNKGHNYFLSQNPYTLNSYAMFGETYFNIAPDLKLTTGLRWTVDQKHFVDIPSEVVTEGYGYGVTGIVNQTWERPTGRAVLDWTPQLDFTDQTLLYASYSHGYKAGGANPPGAVFPVLDTVSQTFPDHPQTFKPEYIEAFELGTKNTLLDGALTLNGDIFYYNYTGYQISEIVDRTAINNNYNAHVEGAEVTANWEPLPGLKFNFAGGWEDTAAAGGDSGIDLMDRTAGMPGWMVVKPVVTAASNCILPTYVVAALLEEQAAKSGSGAGTEGCQVAYNVQLDPVTGLPYTQNPSQSAGLSCCFAGPIPTGYPGFNPNALVNGLSNNNGEGFAKNLAGHALPNAPPLTVSLGGEYSLPVNEDWIATFRTDFYWQADSWARIFNDNPYDRIDGYTNVNLALILTSANGWQVMGYVKNVFNVTAITGDFLNSDDSGLTTNVFLTDPRLYGIRVTKHLDEGDGFWGKEWSGYDFFTDLFSDTDNGKPPLWIEMGGQLEHITGQGAAYAPGFLSTYSTSSILQEKTTPLQAQQPPLFSVGEEAKVSFQPDDSDWVIAASVRYGRSGNKMDVHHQTNGLIHYHVYQGAPPTIADVFTQEKFVDSQIYHAESHAIMDFVAGKDIGLGMFGRQIDTLLSAGIRFAQFQSHSSVDMRARPDLHFQSKYVSSDETKFAPYFHTYHAHETAARKFEGLGPTISWNGSVLVTGNDSAGGLDFDWGANGAVLFGRQKATVTHGEYGRYWPKVGIAYDGNYNFADLVYHHTGLGHTSNRSVVVPNLGGFAGASYRYQNAKISFGYRTDLFFGALDGGIDKPKSEMLNMSGPFATISFGIGG